MYIYNNTTSTVHSGFLWAGRVHTHNFWASLTCSFLLSWPNSSPRMFVNHPCVCALFLYLEKKTLYVIYTTLKFKSLLVHSGYWHVHAQNFWATSTCTLCRPDQNSLSAYVYICVCTYMYTSQVQIAYSMARTGNSLLMNDTDSAWDHIRTFIR